MKTVLILTDFSENANHAAKSAAKIVAKLNADILLYNTCYNHSILPTYAGGPWVVEEFGFLKDEGEAHLDRLAIQLEQLITSISPDGFKPKIAYQCGEGPLGKNIATILQENQVDLIVIGSRSDSTINHLIFGSDTMDVIRHASCPVLVIPLNAEMDMLKNVTLATQFEEADIKAINYLVALCEKLDLRLEVAHVSVPGEKDDPVKEEAIITHINALGQTSISYHDVRGKDAVKRLYGLCKNEGSALLAMVHYHDGLLSGLFNRSATNTALDNQPIPLLAIPSKMSYAAHQPMSLFNS